jgi:hypothetical protein
MSPEERKTAIALELNSVSAQASSAQARAQAWITNKDKLSLCPSDKKLRQRYCLALLYFSTSGAGWSNCSASSGAGDCGGESFLSAADECSWGGVTCNSQGFVTTLHINENNLTGTLPNELSHLAYLEEIIMDTNKLSGTIPASLGALEHLQYLDLDENRLTGELPMNLFNATKLRVLDLDTNLFVGSIPSAIAALSDLYFLQLDFNRMTGIIPTELGSLNKLEYVSMFQNNFTSQLPSSLCGRNIELYAGCSLCPTDACCTACLED